MSVSPRPGVVIVGRFPPPLDGQTIATRQCADALDARWNVARLNTNPPGRDPLSAHPRVSVRRTVHFLRLRRRLRSVMEETDGAPIVWHSISPAPLGHLRDVIATLPAVDAERPIAAVFHRAGSEGLFNSPVFRYTARRLVDKVDLFVFQSQTLADRTQPHIPSHAVRVIPNTVGSSFDYSRNDLEERWTDVPDSRPARLLFLSNMMPEKGIEEVLAAVTMLHEQGVKFELDLAGRWPTAKARASAQEKIERLKLPVIIHDGVTPGQARAMHLRADVFLLPTYHPTETQPIAILEALAAGTPVVSTDRDIIRDMVTDGVHGRLVRSKDARAIAEAIPSITSTTETWLAMARSARIRFVEAFAPAIVAEHWHALVNELHQLAR